MEANCNVLLQDFSFSFGTFVKSWCGDKGFLWKNHSQLEIAELGNALLILSFDVYNNVSFL